MKDEKPKTKGVSKSKAAKRKARNKRRKKRKLVERQHWVTALSMDSAATPTKTQANTQTNERNERETQHTGVNLVERAYQLWQRTYENAVRWVCAQQVNYWRERALQMQKENEKLRNELNQLKKNTGEQQEEEYVTSSSSSGAPSPSPSSYITSDEEEEEASADVACSQTDAEVDEGYLKFMQVTHKHWEELRQQREREQREKEEHSKN